MNLIVATAPLDRVIAIKAIENLAPVTTGHGIVERAAPDLLDTVKDVGAGSVAIQVFDGSTGRQIDRDAVHASAATVHQAVIGQVDARAAIDRIAAAGTVLHDVIIAIASVHAVIACAAVQRVIAGIAVQAVIAVAARQIIGFGAAADRVAVAGADDAFDIAPGIGRQQCIAHTGVCCDAVIG